MKEYRLALVIEEGTSGRPEDTCMRFQWICADSASVLATAHGRTRGLFSVRETHLGLSVQGFYWL